MAKNKIPTNLGQNLSELGALRKERRELESAELKLKEQLAALGISEKDLKKAQPGINPASKSGAPAKPDPLDFTRRTPVKPDSFLSPPTDSLLSGYTISSTFVAREAPQPQRLTVAVTASKKSQEPASRIKEFLQPTREFSESWLDRYQEWNEMVRYFERRANKEQTELEKTVRDPRLDYDRLHNSLPADRDDLRQATRALQATPAENRRERQALVKQLVEGLLPYKLSGSTEWKDVARSATRLSDAAWQAMVAFARLDKIPLVFEDGKSTDHVSMADIGKAVRQPTHRADGKPITAGEDTDALELLRLYYNKTQQCMPRIIPYDDPATGKKVIPYPSVQVIRQMDAATQEYTEKSRNFESLAGKNMDGLSSAQKKALQDRRAAADKVEENGRQNLLDIVNLAVEDAHAALEQWRQDPSAAATPQAIERLRYTLCDVMCQSYGLATGDTSKFDEPWKPISPQEVHNAARAMENAPGTRAHNLAFLLEETFIAHEAVRLWEQSKSAPADVWPALDQVRIAAKLYEPHYTAPQLQDLNTAQPPRPVLDANTLQAGGNTAGATPQKDQSQQK